MVNFFGMGFNRRCFVSGLLAGLSSFVLADFTDGDRAYLEAAASDVFEMRAELRNFIAGVDDDFSDIDVALQANYDAIDRVDDALAQTGNDVSEILSIVQYDIPGLGDKIDDLTDVCESIDQSLDSHLPSIDSRLEDIDNVLRTSFYNITNLLKNASKTSFVTNSYASILPFMPTLPINGYLNRYYQLLFGHSPSSAETQDFLSVYRATSYIAGYYDLFALLSPDDIDKRYASHYNSYMNRFTSAMMDLGLTSSQVNNEKGAVQNFGRFRYYQYGTRPLLEFFQNSTNDNPLAYESAVSYSNVDGRRKSSFTSGFVDTVESLASSFSPSVDTNIAEVVTNDIQDVENSTIAQAWQDAKQTSPDNYALSTLTESVNGIVGAGTSSVLGVFETQGQESLTFDFPFTIGSQTTDLHYDVKATAPLFRPYVAFFAGIAKCLIVVYFGLQIWENVVKDVWMGRRF